MTSSLSRVLGTVLVLAMPMAGVGVAGAQSATSPQPGSPSAETSYDVSGETPKDECKLQDPVGTWDVEASYGEDPIDASIFYSSAGKAYLLDGLAPGGQGVGTWKRTGPCTFEADIEELVYGPDRSFGGRVDIVYTFTMDGPDSYSGSGKSTVFDKEDQEMTTSDTVQTGSRAA